MGINPTQSNFKSFTFDGVNSRQYGVYITGAGVFNAPERNVEMLDIAGRNGAFVLDKGSFLNIEVTYPASIACDNETDFAEAVSDLRNLLCSKVGYVRLEDDYNPNEYRLAIYKSGLEVSHDFLIAGEFDLVFECKPQRYLKTGETAISVTSGDTVTNPTRFDAKPMLEATGYGTIDISGSKIEVYNVPIGDIVVHNSEFFSKTKTGTVTVDDTYANATDTIIVDTVSFAVNCGVLGGYISGVSTSVTGDVTGASYWTGGTYVRLTMNMDNKQFAYGTPSTLTGTASLLTSTTDFGDITMTVTLSLAYDGTDSFTVTASYTMPANTFDFQTSQYPRVTVGAITLQSTQYATGNPMYIDLEIGECYKIESGSAVSVNNAVQMPSELPTLQSGANTITYDNTFTQFKVVPRWWKV